jgi:hypothetical protein
MGGDFAKARNFLGESLAERVCQTVSRALANVIAAAFDAREPLEESRSLTEAEETMLISRLEPSCLHNYDSRSVYA